MLTTVPRRIFESFLFCWIGRFTISFIEAVLVIYRLNYWVD